MVLPYEADFPKLPPRLVPINVVMASQVKVLDFPTTHRVRWGARVCYIMWQQQWCGISPLVTNTVKMKFVVLLSCFALMAAMASASPNEAFLASTPASDTSMASAEPSEDAPQQSGMSTLALQDFATFLQEATENDQTVQLRRDRRGGCFYATVCRRGVCFRVRRCWVSSPFPHS